jgi:hypothetical protein
MMRSWKKTWWIVQLFNLIFMYPAYLLCLLLTSFSFSCTNPDSIKADAKRQLEERYGEKFDILSYTEIVLEKPRYEMTACPHDQPEHVFQLTVTKSSGVMMDNYIFSTWLYEASDELRNSLRPDFPKLAVLVEPNLAYLDSVDEKNIPTFGEALKHQREGDDLNVTVYFFRDYNDSTEKEIFAGVRKVVQFFNDKGVLKVNYDFKFYDEHFFKNLDTDHQHYQFQGRFFHYSDDFESTYLKKVRFSLNFDSSYNDSLPDDSFLKAKMFDWSTLHIK